MAFLRRSLKPITTWGLDILKFKKAFIGLIIIGFGVLLGYLFSGPPETAEVTISIFVVSLAMLIIIRNPLNGILIWIMFMPFIETWVNIPLGAGIPDLSYPRFIIAFLAIFLLAKAATGRFQFAPIDLADICIIGTTVGLMSAAPQSIHPTSTIQWVITFQLAPLLIYFFAKNLVRGKGDLQKLFWTIVLFGFVAASYAIYEQTTGNILFLSKGVDAENVRTTYTESLRLIRGLLGRSSSFARVFLSSIPLTFYLFFEDKSKTRKFLLVGMLIVQFYAHFLTYNRMGWIALLFSLFIIQIFYPQFRKVFLLIVLVSLVVLGATWEQVNDSAVVEERIHGTSTLEGRQTRWAAGFNMWRAKPITGWGFGRFRRVGWRFRTDGVKRNWRNGAIENDYLDLMVGSGLVGFLPYLLFLLTPLLNSVRLYFRARAPDWSGFIKLETIAVYWGIILAFAAGSYTQIQPQPMVKMLAFAVAGAVVGSHVHILRDAKAEKRSFKTGKLTLPQEQLAQHLGGN